MKHPNLKKLNTISLDREFKPEEFLNKMRMTLGKDGYYVPTKLTNEIAAAIANACNRIIERLKEK